jgi:hypothetical protein
MAKKKQKKSVLFWIILVLVVAGGLWYYYKMPEKPASEPVAPKEITGAQKGDLVAIDFVLTMANGSVVDTNDPAVAREYNITTFSKGPFRFILGQSGKVKGFDEAIAGAELGQNFTRIIAPSELVVKYVINRTRHIPRNLGISRYQGFSAKSFEKTFGKKPVLGDIVSNPRFSWPYKIVNMSNPEVVVCDAFVTEGKTYKLPSLEWNSTLMVIAHNDLMFRHNPKDGMIIHTELGEATVHPGLGVLNITYKAKAGDVFKYAPDNQKGAEIAVPHAFAVTESDDTAFVLTRINYLPQETLVLKAVLTEWTKDVKEVKEPLKAKVTVS